MNNATIKEAFEVLTTALSRYGLPTSAGPDRVNVPAGEFMLMNTLSNGGWAFKHCETRNYLYCYPNGKLVVPTGSPFHQGYFDA